MNNIYFNHSAFQNNPFVFRSEDNILHEDAIGIAGDRGSVMTPPVGAAILHGLQNCPWPGSEFSLEIRMDGERISGREWTWLPNAIIRKGRVRNWEAQTITLIPPKKNGCLLFAEFTNKSAESIEAPIQIIVGGGFPVKKTDSWLFGIPSVNVGVNAHFASVKEVDVPQDKASYLELIGFSSDVDGCEYSKDDTMCIVGCSLENMHWFGNGEIWETIRTIAPGETCQMVVSLHLGPQTDALLEEARQTMAKPEKVMDSALEWLETETNRIFSALPRFSSDNSDLEALYYRSLVTYTLNRWENPYYYTSPFYSTGSINGGCMCSYLWDYGGGIMLHPIVDPETNKKMIRSFLHIDLCNSFAILPLDGKAYGPWYHINQEKIIGMIYFHILHTGDTAFLDEVVDGRSILEWVIFHVSVGDDWSKPVTLMDYGDAGKSHLELRRENKGYVYKGVMPDLNARRYRNFLYAYAITAFAEKPEPKLLERAEALKTLLPSLWDEEAGWYDFIWEGKRQKRYTVQMFKFLNSGIIDKVTQDKLVAHLNDKEFLSKFGLHSISKLDPAYDQVDIDNGGGGICTLFTMQIVWQLYDIGYDALATDILKRVLWWGTRLPYMGDSCAANMLMQRTDSPLQSGISSVSCAQTIIFGVCGIRAELDGSVVICPSKNLPAKCISLTNMHLCGMCFSLEIQDGMFAVIRDGEVVDSKPLGEHIILQK